MAPANELQLTVTYDPRKTGYVANVDLVLVHGFGGHFEETWTFREAGRRVFWPLDLLRWKQPRTRILSFGYDAGNTTVATIRDNARTLLAYLDCEREDDDRESRPIVFLGHCLGGLIVRQAMCFAEVERDFEYIVSATKSIMFFGTPHGGGDKIGWRKLAEAYGQLGRGCKMVDVLTSGAEDLIEIDEDFCRMAANYHIVNFIETQKFSTTGKVIVDKTSAVRTANSESGAVFVDGDHITMCKFRRDDANAFVKVCKVIGKVAQVAERPGRTLWIEKEVEITEKATRVTLKAIASQPEFVQEPQKPRQMLKPPPYEPLRESESGKPAALESNFWKFLRGGVRRHGQQRR